MTITVASLCFIFLGTAVAFRDYQEHIPNGDRVPDPCHPNKLWQGVGHKQLSGGGDRNLFGKDFKEAGKKWTVQLCKKDSDGDGKTNGQELGDPNCVWVEGGVPEFLDDLSHPGICEPYESDKCQAINTFEVCQEQEFICPLKDEEGVIKETYRMTNNNVPAQDTTYQCQYMELPKDRDYHLIASEPFIDNANVMHHIILRGCKDDVKDDVQKDYSMPKECGMLAGVCGEPLGGWTLGVTGSCIDAPAAIRFGKTRFSGFIMEFHWTNPALRDDYWDSSGMTLYYTPNLRPHDAGMLATGQMHLLLPSQQKEITVESICPSKCTKKILKEPIKLISGLHHMHLLGNAGFVDHYHDGKKNTIIDEPYFSYDSPKTFEYKPEVVINPGDELVTKCVYNTMTRQETTYWGDDTFSEMCFGFFTYYPSDNGETLSCMTFGETDCMTSDDSECDMDKVIDAKDEFVRGLYEYCDPTGNTCSKCCLLYLKSSLKGDPCWEGVMRETTQFAVTDGWDDRNVTRMLLKCEELHDLDALLAVEEGDDKIETSGSCRGFVTTGLFLVAVGSKCIFAIF